VARVRAARRALARPSAQRSLAELGALDGGGWPGREVARATIALAAASAELEAVDIVLRDPERGLVDFPSIRAGREIYLCWLVDQEDEVGWWHEPETGFAGRRPLR
jgi:hypothetical protein